MSNEKKQITDEEKTLEKPEESAKIGAGQSGATGIDYQSQFLRVTADFNNYQRRVEKERSMWMQTARTSVIGSFLPVVDDVERALAATEGKALDEAGQTVVEGLSLMAKNLKKILNDLGVEEIDCSGAFDPKVHEALMQTESDAHESGAIVAVLVKGYMHKEAVIRHAKVSVAV